MDQRTQAVLLLALAAISLRLGITEDGLAYIKPTFQPLLIAGGIGIAVLGIDGAIRAYRRPIHDRTPASGDGHHDDVHADEAHDHHHAPGIAWMLAVPLLTLMLIAPPALGSFAAARQGNLPPAVAGVFAELPEPRDGAVDLAIREYAQRALYDPGNSLEGVPVRLLGFVAPIESGGYRLTRFTVNCCAADATAVSVEVVGDYNREEDTWLEIVGRWEPRPAQGGDAALTEPPLLVAERVTPVAPPSEPYEY